MINNLLRLNNTDSPIIDMRKTYQQNSITKPNGLYYSIGFEWILWAQSNMVNKIKENYFHISFDFNKIYFITDKKSLDLFFDNFYNEETLLIDWQKVSENYSGIEVHNVNSEIYNPFIKGFSKTKPYADSLKYAFIKSFDVDSGCIWNLSDINLIAKLTFN